MSRQARSARVLVISEYGLIRSGIRALISKSNIPIATVGEACAGTALEIAIEKRPSLILHDIDQCPLPYHDLFTTLKSRLPDAEIIALTTSLNTHIFRHAYRSGARAVFPMARSGRDLLGAIEKVINGELWVDIDFIQSMLNDNLEKPSKGENEDKKLDRLTKRESEIVLLVARGYRNKQIAYALSISPTTVRHHLCSIFDKLEVSDHVELMIFMYRSGLAQPELDTGRGAVS